MKKFNVHDQELFEKIQKVFTQDLQMYLNDFDFGNMGHSNVFDGLFEMKHYINTMNYEFLDIDDMFKNNYDHLKKEIHEFWNSFCLYTTPTGDGMFQVASIRDWEMGDSTRYRDEANKINDSAKNLFDAMKVFIKNGKIRIATKESIMNKNEINIYGGNHGIASIGDNNMISTISEFDKKLLEVIEEIKNSELHDKENLVKQIHQAKADNNKVGVMQILGGILTRGAEAAGFAASIGTLLTL